MTVLPPFTNMHPPYFSALPLAKPKPVNVTSDPLSMQNIPPLLLLNDLSEVMTAPLLLKMVKPVTPEIVTTAVKVISLTTSMLASLVIALDRAENVDTGVMVGAGVMVGTCVGTCVGERVGGNVGEELGDCVG